VAIQKKRLQRKAGKWFIEKARMFRSLCQSSWDWQWNL